MSHWIFLADKITAKDQATVHAIYILGKDSKGWFKVWSVTADGWAVNLRTLEIVG